MLLSLAIQGFGACFTPENRGKPEDQASLLLGTKADFHGNGSESGSELIGVYQQMHRYNQREKLYIVIRRIQLDSILGRFLRIYKNSNCISNIGTS